MDADHAKSRKAAKRRHRVRSLERAADQAWDEHSKITDLIAEAPAKGRIGLAVKLAVCMREREHLQEPAMAIVTSCYEEVSKLTGTDLVAEVQVW